MIFLKAARNCLSRAVEFLEAWFNLLRSLAIQQKSTDCWYSYYLNQTVTKCFTLVLSSKKRLFYEISSTTYQKQKLHDVYKSKCEFQQNRPCLGAIKIGQLLSRIFAFRGSSIKKQINLSGIEFVEDEVVVSLQETGNSDPVY